METTRTALVVAPSTALATPSWRTLARGTWVKMTSFDPYGFCGRERHPNEDDVGFLGQVERTSLSILDEEGCLVSHDEDAPAGTLVTSEHSYACYLVRAPSGRMLDLMGHEIEVVEVVVTAL